ncbi:MAG: ATP-binding protein [Candidatus Shapirobacteria bacterium]|jgi:signal transduction histidine kinase
MFEIARLKLTAWYLFIIMLVCLFFSTFIYRLLSVELERVTRIQRIRLERPFNWRQEPPPPLSTLDIELVEDIRHRLLVILISINGGILLISGGFGYFLAGRTLKPIQTMLDDQNRFVSDASHELRTPLTSLKTSLEVSLRDPKLTLSEAKSLIAGSLSQVDQLQQLSNYLLDLSRYQNPKNIPKNSLPLKTMISRSIIRLKPQAEAKKIKIVTKISSVKITGDTDKLTDLFTILLDNAIKYSHSGKTINIRVNPSPKSVSILFKDHGIGISKKDLPHIFDRFYRADSARSHTDTPGYGLGLSIAKNIVDSHHGSIVVYSRLHHGTTVTVTLPIS